MGLCITGSILVLDCEMDLWFCFLGKKIKMSNVMFRNLLPEALYMEYKSGCFSLSVTRPNSFRQEWDVLLLLK